MKHAFLMLTITGALVVLLIFLTIIAYHNAKSY